MKTKTIVILAVAGVVVLGGAGALALGMSQPKKTASYITAPVQISDIESSVMATGTLQPADVVDVGAQASGQLISLTVRLGDNVKKGQKIGEIESQQLNNQLRMAQNQLNSTVANRANQAVQLQLAEANANRQRLLQAQGMAATATLQQAEATLKQQQTNAAQFEVTIQNAQLQVESAQNNLEKANVRAPIDGIVAEVVTQEGSTVSTNNQVPIIVRVAKMDMMTVKAQVSEADIIRVRQGQAVYFTILGDPYHRYYGKLRAVEFTPSTGQLDPSKGAAAKQAIYYNALFDVPNVDGRLLPGMTANVHVVLGAAKQVPTVPAAALGKQLSANVYLVQVEDAKGQVVSRQVTVGLSDELAVEIKSGLKVGDKVVIGQAGPASSGSGGGSMFSLPSSLKS